MRGCIGGEWQALEGAISVMQDGAVGGRKKDDVVVDRIQIRIKRVTWQPTHESHETREAHH